MARAKRQEEPKVRGVWERIPGSGVFWVRFRDSDGKLHREKIGRKGDAIDLLNKRRNERRVGIKMPKNLRTVPIRFGEIADHITEEFTQEHHEDSRNIKQRLGKLKAFFGERSAESIKPEEIDRWLGQNTKTGSTANRYRSAMSLAYREAILAFSFSRHCAAIWDDRNGRSLATTILHYSNLSVAGVLITPAFAFHLWWT